MAKIVFAKPILDLSPEDKEKLKAFSSFFQHLGKDTDFCQHASCLKCPFSNLCVHAPDIDTFTEMLIQKIQEALE